MPKWKTCNISCRQRAAPWSCLVTDLLGSRSVRSAFPSYWPAIGRTHTGQKITTSSKSLLRGVRWRMAEGAVWVNYKWEGKLFTDFYSRTWRHRYRRKFATILGWCPATFLDRIKLRHGRARGSPTDVITNTPARENNISGWNGERRDKLSMGFDNFVGWLQSCCNFFMHEVHRIASKAQQISVGEHQQSMRVCEYVLPPTLCCKEQVINVEQGVCAVPPAPFPSAEEDECPLNIFFLRKKNHLHPSKINQIQHKKSSKNHKSMNKTHRIHENSQPSWNQKQASLNSSFRTRVSTTTAPLDPDLQTH